MNDAIMAAVAEAIAQCVPYAMFIALAERVINILVRAVSGRERYF